MKTATALLVSVSALALLVRGAAAQEAPATVVCPTGNPDECYAVDPAAMAGSTTPEPAPAGDAMGMEAALPPEAAPQVWLRWEGGRDRPDPALQVPGLCAWTASRARARFVQAMEAGDANALVATYQWRGRSEAASEPLVARLTALPAQGHWERSAVEMWSGPDDTPDRAPVFWRWVAGETATDFAMREVDGCWFVEFTDAPDEGLFLDGDAPTDAGPQPRFDPPVEPDGVDVLVF